MADEKAHGRIDDLRSAADTAAGSLRGVYLTFLLTAVYIAVVVGSTTDMQLLLVSPVNLPILNVGLPMVSFYTVVPWLIVLLHFNLLLQLTLLADKLHRLAALIDSVQDIDERKEQRTRLFPFTFSYMLMATDQSWYMRIFLSGFVWVTMVWFPLMLLVAMQVRFLPYHDLTITWIQRIAVLIDLFLLWIFWPRMLSGSGQIGLKKFFHAAWSRVLWLAARMSRRTEIPAVSHQTSPGVLSLGITTILVVVFAFPITTIPGERMERIVTAMTPQWMQWQSDPLLSARAGYLRITHRLFEAPGSVLHRNLQLAEQMLVASAPTPDQEALLRNTSAESFYEAFEKIAGLGLTGRDLRYADMRGASLIKTNLRGANLEGVDLRGAILAGVDLRPLEIADGGACIHNERQFIRVDINSSGNDSGSPGSSVDLLSLADLTPPRGNSVHLCRASVQYAKLMNTTILHTDFHLARMDDADFTGSHLIDTPMVGAQANGIRLVNLNAVELDARHAELGCSPDTGICVDLSDAHLMNADLESADLAGAKLSRANLDSVNLVSADLSRSNLARASLRSAKTRGAKFNESDLSGADFSGASLFAIDLELATLAGADFTGTRIGDEIVNARRNYANIKIPGARLKAVDLTRANFENADLRGVDFSGAILVETRFSKADLGGADFGGAELAGAQFAEAELTATNFSRATAELAQFDGARLFATDFSQAVLIGATFRDAWFVSGRLRKARLQGADLQFHYFMGIDLQGAELAGAAVNADDMNGIYINDIDYTPLETDSYQQASQRLRKLVRDQDRHDKIAARLEGATKPATISRLKSDFDQMCRHQAVCLVDERQFITEFIQRVLTSTGICDDSYALGAFMERELPRPSGRGPAVVEGNARVILDAMLADEDCQRERILSHLNWR